MENNDWEELDEMCRYTIRIFLSKSVYYNVKDVEGGGYELWQRICDMYDKHSVTSMVYWIKKIIDLRMEERASMNAHLNEFNTIFSQLATQKITFEDNVKAMFLLVTLPESWDTFRIAISNSVLVDELTSTNVESSFLTKEINRKNNAAVSLLVQWLLEIANELRLNFSSAYHPQTDGQSEIANLTVLDLLKAYVMEVYQRSQWEKYLPLVEYAYNNTVHTSTGKAPFEVIEGRPKSPLLLKVHGKIFAADEYSRDLKESFQKIKEAISIAQQKQKAAANKHRRALAFKENDWVLLKFPKARLRHTTGKNPTGHQKYYAKLAERYYGPFQILKSINEMAYQLKFPKHWLIHNAFHVSLLKPYKGEPPKEAITEDPPEVEGQEVLQPKSVLRHEDKVLRNGKFIKKCPSIDNAGYLPSQLYNLNDSKYGTKAQLEDLIDVLHMNGICCMGDIVINHRSASRQDAGGHWNVFE
ncbi:hypothetical protein L7F22_051085 [Adiantum nelumboides]|nr:hypothetical protein [Adiantum nelumboides]